MKSSTPSFSSQRGLQLSSVDWLINHHRAKESDRREMVDALEIKPGDYMLDAACGPGLWTRLFAEKVFPAGGVVGLDFSPDLIRHARISLIGDPLASAMEFVLGDLHNPPFAPESFDVVFLGNCLCYLPETDFQDILRKHQRLVRKGGRLISKEFDGATVIFHPLAPEFTLRVVSLAARALEEHPSTPVFDNFVGRKTHGLFRKIGLRNVTTRSYAVQKVPPLTRAAKLYITGNAGWYSERAARYLSAGERQRWDEAFEPGSRRYILDRDDFYFCMLETVTIGTV